MCTIGPYDVLSFVKPLVGEQSGNCVQIFIQFRQDKKRMDLSNFSDEKEQDLVCTGSRKLKTK